MRDRGVETVRYFTLAAEFGRAGVFRAKADLFGSGALEQDPNGRKYLFVLRLKNIAVQLFPLHLQFIMEKIYCSQQMLLWLVQ